MEFTWAERARHVPRRLFHQHRQWIGGEPARRGLLMITTSQAAQLGSIVSLVADASLTALGGRLHRGSLDNARLAIAESRAAEARSQAMLREFSSLSPMHKLAASG